MHDLRLSVWHSADPSLSPQLSMEMEAWISIDMIPNFKDLCLLKFEDFGFEATMRMQI